MEEIKEILQKADAIVIGAGAGLSASAGFEYSGERFKAYFQDFEEKYGFCDMYSGGFTDFDSLEENFAYWSRHIFVNRYENAPKPVYEKLLGLVKDKNYFVITTNVDHCFQKAGFDKKRLFYTQGDYGLWQCSVPCHKKTYDNADSVKKMLEDQGFIFEKDGKLSLPENGFSGIKMKISSSLIPRCPKCGKPMTENLRCDGTFVEDDGWKNAAKRYQDFLSRYSSKKIAFLELGVGSNTPGIIKYPFWQMTYSNSCARYICINKGEALVPEEIKCRSICVNGNIMEEIEKLQG